MNKYKTTEAAFENTVREEENACKVHFVLFPHFFVPLTIVKGTKKCGKRTK